MLSEEYRDFTELFMNEISEETLLAHQSWDHKILIIKDKTSKKTSIYSLSSEKLKALWVYLDENLKKEFIWESQSLTGYLILFVLKKDKMLWLCINYQRLNNITVKNSYLLSLISELQDQLKRAKIFSKFNISDAYNWIWIKSDKEWKTAMRTCFELYKYLVISFELINAPVMFQTYINNVLREYLDVFVVIYLNDILVYFKKEADHKLHVRKVLEALKKADLKIKSEKSQFHQTEINF